MKNQKGISLVILIITIIVIIIITGIIVPDLITTPAKASLTVFRGDMDLLEEAVAVSYANLFGDYAEDGIQMVDSKIYAEIATGNINAVYNTVVFPDKTRSIVFINESHKIKNLSGLPDYKDEDDNKQQLGIDPQDGTVYMIPGFKHKEKYYYSVDAEGESTAAFIE